MGFIKCLTLYARRPLTRYGIRGEGISAAVWVFRFYPEDLEIQYDKGMADLHNSDCSLLELKQGN